MRSLPLIIFASLIGGAAAAQPAPPSVPRAFSDYSQPDVTPGLCKNVSPTQTQCVIPAMTAGRYVVERAGTSTATAADAEQAVELVVGDTPCGKATSAKGGDWAVGKPKTLRFRCVVTVLTDKPLTVVVGYGDTKATKDPKGPTLTIRRVPWSGVLQAQAAGGGQQ